MIQLQQQRWFQVDNHQHYNPGETLVLLAVSEESKNCVVGIRLFELTMLHGR